MGIRLKEALNSYKEAITDDSGTAWQQEETITKAEKAIRQAVVEEMLELIEANTDRDGSARSISVAKLRQKIKDWAALKEPSK